MRIDPQNITGLILAGGRGSRMGSVDKGLQSFKGQPLVLHALKRLTAQVGAVMVNANRNLPDYQSLGIPVWPDATADFAGPLSGFLVGLAHCQTPYLLIVPCDSPSFPPDLADRLARALSAEDAEIAMVAAPQTDAYGHTELRKQPVFCLLKANLLDSLMRFTQAGGRKVETWTSQHRTAVVPFDTPNDPPRSFCNINTLQELQALENDESA